ncbi:MAG: PVC-type heme-binding CxxCH protein [Planctomycetaceae bacterium]
MGDYPRGAPDSNGWSPGRSATGKPWDGPAGGRIRTLTDTNGDGRYDEGVTFLDGLTFPTGVYPWRDGVLISCAPDIVFAQDTDGDGKSDTREVLYTGFVEENPQHRVNGFELGLDGWLYLGSGAPNREITCVKSGEKVDISGRDLRIHPDTNRLEPVSGRSQFGRCRDDFGNWFGNTNSEPLFQFVIDDRQLRRNPYVSTPSPRPMLSGSGRATPLFPTSRTVDRFNDVYAANRFTSACAPQVFRDVTLGNDVVESVFFCEPVHNLVSRMHVERTGPQFSAARFPSETAAEFLSSSDPWSRPVRMLTGPDGGLWLCDMYRLVIEHPQWIPEAWQARINLSAGSDRGRIYRVKQLDSPSKPIPNLAALSSVDLIPELTSTNGWHRDTAQRLLIERGDVAIVPALRQLATSDNSAVARCQALWTLAVLEPETRHDADLQRSFLSSPDAELVIQGLRVFGLSAKSVSKSQWDKLRQHPDTRVRYELALAAGDCADLSLRAEILRGLAVENLGESWIRTAILSSSVGVAPELLREVLVHAAPSPGREALVEGLIGTALGDQPEVGAIDVLAAIAPADGTAPADWQIAALGVCLDGLARRKQSLQTLSAGSDERQQAAVSRITPVLVAARERVRSESTPDVVRVASIRLLGRQPDSLATDKEQLTSLLTAQQSPEVQSAAIERLALLLEAEPLLAALTRLGPAQQAAIEAALLQQTSLTIALLNAVQSGELDGRRLSAATRSALTSHRDAATRAAAVKLIGEAPKATVNVSERLARIAPLTGDVTHGRLVFEKRCATCHKHNGLGTEVGPQLAALQNKTTEFLLTQILDTNRSVEPKYRSCNVLLIDGRQQTGLVSDETATSLTLVTADGRKHSILRRDIDELVLTGLSFMPEGIDKDLSDQDLADVIRLLQTTE